MKQSVHSLIAKNMVTDICAMIDKEEKWHNIEEVSNSLCWVVNNYSGHISDEVIYLLLEKSDYYLNQTNSVKNYKADIFSFMSCLYALKKSKALIDMDYSLLSHHNASIRKMIFGSLICSYRSINWNSETLFDSAFENIEKNQIYSDDIFLFYVFCSLSNSNFLMNELIRNQPLEIRQHCISLIRDMDINSLRYCHDILRKAKLTSIHYLSQVVMDNWDSSCQIEYIISEMALKVNDGFPSFIDEKGKEIILDFLVN